jgi:NAD-dependent DNA ligase
MSGSILKGKVICFTGFSSDEDRELSSLVSSLGGYVTPNLLKTTFCLVCNKHGTTKYEVASTYKIPCVTSLWLLDSKKANQLMNTADYQFKLFSCLIFSVSGINGHTRNKLIQTIEEYGGKYSSDLVENPITHLICEIAAGEKYAYAMELGNVKILKPSWVHESISSNRKLIIITIFNIDLICILLTTHRACG